MAFPRAILFFGPPGSGKTTQAEAIVLRHENFQHLNMGRLVEEILYDEKRSNDPEIQLEREAFENGRLVSAQFVIKIMEDWVYNAAAAGRGVVFSGNPRRIEEAEILVPLLARLYGEGTTVAIHLAIKEETTFFRNSHRRICTQCGTPVEWGGEAEGQVFCKVCGGELKSRTLDNEEAIKERLYAYHHITERIIPFLKASGVPIVEVDGERSSKEISDDIEHILEEF